MAPKYSIIIPTLNEGKTIYGVIKGIPSAISRESEIIVVDGRSTDETVSEANRAGARVLMEKRKGKGAAVRKGIGEARGEFCILIDGDGSMKPEEIERLTAVSGDFDLVVGSRFLGRPDDVSPMHFLGNYVHNKIASLLFTRRITDINSGFKVIRSRAAKKLGLKSDGFEIEAEMILKALRMGCRYCEVSVFTVKRQHGQAKLSYRDGFRILKKIIQMRIWPLGRQAAAGSVF
ncbi:MAG: glycosyltransferase family 2 protein [Candidatus Aenigmatarchaeota archaeon]